MSRSLFITWQNKSTLASARPNTSSTVVNFGPQHPAAHGVLRLILELRGEIIERTDTHIGLLHRGTERLIESKHFEQSLPYFDRLDYVSMMTQEHAYCLAIEYLLNKKVPNTLVNLQRVLFDELTRLLNHFLAVACHALDVGSMSSIFWAFEEREKIMEFYERVSGARMHAAYHRPHELFNLEISTTLLNDILFFIKNAYVTLNEMHNMLSYNKIWKQRLINIGAYSIKSAQEYGLTGVLARCTGLKRDLRLSWKESYSGYNQLLLKSFIGQNGDCYDRFLIRMFEMGESLNVSNQCVNKIFKTLQESAMAIKTIKAGTQLIANYDKRPQKATEPYLYMEDLITHFLSWHSGIQINTQATSIFIESPKGEFGVTLISNNSTRPTRCKIRSPAYHNLQFLPKLVKGHMLGDLAALVGTIDIVFGEIDR